MAKRRLAERMVRRFFYKYYSTNLLYELQLRAKKEATDYFHENMLSAVILERRDQIFRFCIDRAELRGIIAEFGVATGRTINLIAKLAEQKVFGFDSFEGLPDDWRGHNLTLGAFASGKCPPKTLDNVELLIGWFEDTLPKFVEEHDGNAKLLHLDCDIYASTVTVLENFADRIVPGTVLIFDEYFNYPAWRDHEFRAWQELVVERGLAYDYIALTASGGSVAVKVR